MSDKFEELKRAMDSTTHKGVHFNQIHKQRIRSAIHSNSLPQRKPAILIVFSLSAAAAAIMFVLFSGVLMQDQVGDRSAALPKEEQWIIRDEYKEKDGTIFSVFPEPNLTAGKSAGYIFSFAEPFPAYEGKTLSINAVNKETGEQINVVPQEKIIEPSPGYSSLQRFATSFEIPYAGVWKYEVILDGDYYGDVVLSVAEEQGIILPEDIPGFVKKEDFQDIDWTRKAVELEGNMLGNENKSGVIGADMPSLTPQKWMWHLWGNESSEFTVAGFHRKTQEVHPVLDNGWAWTMKLGGALNGADAHIPTAVTITKAGEWAILIYDGEELFDVLVFDIEK
ncbi:hypothetical protein D3H55_07445 [Bacillus salacetis]|uniref:DUF4871 domain-containing protein n=1 Tax=Bacillus salacetis TaxID=2315464 RepID=A0A3A1R4L6_9BACI|nr:hypothetical protein [Bacillus salacetis]RIW35706.1 hypothetical protein D3H55_07445 [Bacillus salacetis]